MPTSHFRQVVAFIAIAVLALFTVSMVRFPRQLSGTSSSDHSYDQVELLRARNYSANADRSDEQIELQRAETYRAAAAQQAYLDQRRGEWTAGQAAVTAPAQLPFRQAEQVAAAGDAERAYLVYRAGERNPSVSPEQAYLDYRMGEESGK